MKALTIGQISQPVSGLVFASIAGLVLIATPYLGFLILYGVVRPKGSPADKTVIEPSVSVVLPTYNEAAIVEGKLEDICGQDYPMSQIQVVVVDASDDETVNITREFFSERRAPELTVIEEEERRGLAVALNDAYAAARGEIVIKTDCDSLLAEDAIREAVMNFADPDVGAVTGRNTEVLGGSAVESSYRDIQAKVQTLESHLDSTFIFHGPCSAFDADEIVTIDSDSLADDTEMALKIRKKGKRVLFDPAVRFKEAAHSEFRKRRRQKDRRAMGLLRLLWRQRRILGSYGNYGRVVLPFNWWFMVISPWLVVFCLILSSVAAIVTTGLTGLVVPGSLAAFVFVGSKEKLGPIQPVYALFDTQVSLWLASLRLLISRADGTWETDAELREAYE